MSSSGAMPTVEILTTAFQLVSPRKWQRALHLEVLVGYLYQCPDNTPSCNAQLVPNADGMDHALAVLVPNEHGRLRPSLLQWRSPENRDDPFLTKCLPQTDWRGERAVSVRNGTLPNPYESTFHVPCPLHPSLLSWRTCNPASPRPIATVYSCREYRVPDLIGDFGVLCWVVCQPFGRAIENRMTRPRGHYKTTS